MTDRISGYIVTLDSDLREDDQQTTLAAIRQIRGVYSALPVTTSVEAHLARERAKSEMRDKFYNFYLTLFPN